MHFPLQSKVSSPRTEKSQTHLASFEGLESKSHSELNLARCANSSEYSAGVGGKLACRILKQSIPVSSLRQRTLRVAWDSEVGVI